jgi:uncharacterized protein (TIGR03437 family)
MRFVAVFLLGCVAASSQRLSILPPSLDASGQTIFFGSSLYPSGLQYAMDIYADDSRGVRPLTQIGVDSHSTVSEFTVSPDGSHLAYAAVIGGAAILRSLNLNSSENSSWTCPSQLCTSRDSSLHIGSGNTIIIGGHRFSQLSAEIHSVNADGSFTFLSRGILAPSSQRVSSDSGLIVFTQYQSVPANVYVMNLDGSNAHPLTQFPVPPQGVYTGKVARDATISQSGGLVVFATTDAALENRSQVWAVTSDGLLRSLSGPDENCGSPSLTGDGTLAAFVCNGQVNISLADGTRRRALTNFRWSAASSPVISADGSRVIFTIGPPGNASTTRGAIYAIGTDGIKLEKIYAPRVLSPGGVEDSLSIYRSLVIGDLITASGTNFTADSLSVAAERPLPDSLNGISLLVNGRATPILAVTPWQINAQLPPWATEGLATFQLRFEDGSSSNITKEQIGRNLPQPLFLTSSTSDCQLAVFHAGTGIPADQQHPAAIGETVEIYAVGLGPTDPVIPAGALAPNSPPSKITDVITVYLDDYSGQVTAPVLFAGLTPGLIGIYQINVTIPKRMPGYRQVALQMNNGTVFGTSCGFWVR